MTVIKRIFSKKTLYYAVGGTALAAGGGVYYLNSGPAFPASTRETRRPPPPWTPPSRAEMLDRLKASGSKPTLGSVTKLSGSPAEDEEYDLLIVGGGATGAGVAVDAATRGLKVALVERDDFSSGESLLRLFFS
jgi:glycerol-3-phosphate dehydrogenase